MNRLLTCLPLVLFLMTAAGCGSNYSKREQALQDTLTTMEELASTLDMVKDEPTAKAAAPKIVQIAGRLDQLATEFESLPTLTKAEHDKLEAQFNDKFAALREKFTAHRQQLSKLQKSSATGESPLNKALERLQLAQKNMQKAAKRLQAS